MPFDLTPPLTREHSPSKYPNRETHKIHTHPRHHNDVILSNWRYCESRLAGFECALDGRSLTVGDVVAIARQNIPVSIADDPDVRRRMVASVELLKTHLQNGDVIYGVNTGFGGSADVRTSDHESLQRGLLQMQTTGILTSSDIGKSLALSVDFDIESQSMPSSWVRASMLTRCNSLVRGHSAVRLEIVEAILALLSHDITPVVPMRGSISASGDLAPLSYIAGAIEGNPDIYVRVGKGVGNVINSRDALRTFKLRPITLAAKEGLGLLNGTAFSAATASIAVYQAQEIAALSQVLTAMCVEALQGTAESFQPMIAAMRPHPGQLESAANILSFLQGSSLARGVSTDENTEITGLCQDRYATRTASQWIGPQLEDLVHAQRQLTIELNSTTDNPLIDIENNEILHGGNFQAAVVTSTMDRTRICLERLGKMLFSQATEIVNPMMNNGLPANLASDNPAISFTGKGIDINMAAYASELGVLANPVGNHVQSAEMHNQSLNSLAFISARYTHQALDIIYIMSAAYLFLLCQALDLRVLQIEFLSAMEDEVQKLVAIGFGQYVVNDLKKLQCSVWKDIVNTWPTTTTSDLSERCNTTAESIISNVVNFLSNAKLSNSPDFSTVISLKSSLSEKLSSQYEVVRHKMYINHVTITKSYLGNASKCMYAWVREDLDIRFHRGLVEHPTQPHPEWMTVGEAEERQTIGHQVSTIYEALRDGRSGQVLTNILQRSTDTINCSQTQRDS